MYNQAVSDAEQIIQLAGCYNLTINMEKKHYLYNALIHCILLGRNKQCFEEFCEGLKTLGVLNALKKTHPKMKELFVFGNSIDKLSSHTLELLFDIEFSEEGSNIRAEEEITLTNWRDMLIDLEGTVQDIDHSYQKQEQIKM